MDLLPNKEQSQVIDACINFLEKELPVDRIHKVDTNNPLINRSILKQIAELGWLGLALPEEHGGVGYSLKEEALLFIELGRYLISPAILASVLAARVAALAGKTELSESIVAGEKLIAPAIAAAPQTLKEAKPGIGKTVKGNFYVFDGQDADYILFANEAGLALVEKSACGNFETLSCMDEKVHMASSVVEASTLAYVATETENIYLRGVLLTAAMQLGVAQATRDRSVEYAKVREQYGKPIGAFQAIKHNCAEMAVKCESVMSMLYHAAIVLNDPQGPYGENFQFDTITAKVLASDAAQGNANAAVQIHGGMGFTEEMDIHLFVKRAYIYDQLFGSKRQQAKQLINLAGPIL